MERPAGLIAAVRTASPEHLDAAFEAAAEVLMEETSRRLDAERELAVERAASPEARAGEIAAAMSSTQSAASVVERGVGAIVNGPPQSPNGQAAKGKGGMPPPLPSSTRRG